MRQLRCTMCRKAKLMVEFYINRAYRTGRDNLCKACRTEVNASEPAREARRRYAARQRGENVPLKKRGWKSSVV